MPEDIDQVLSLGPAPRKHDSARARLALDAWRRLGLGGSQPTSTQVLKDAVESFVVRLDGIGPAGESVIAKTADVHRLRRAAAAQRVLNGFTIEAQDVADLAPQCYGLVQSDDGPWLFQADAGGERFQRGNRAHRALLSRLAGTIHRHFADADLAELPVAGAPRHRAQTTAILHALEAAKHHPDVSPARLVRVDALVATLQDTLSGWNRVEQACAALPTTLVHGDLQEPNLRIVESGGSQIVRILDWEWAGRGAPAIDLASRIVDLRIYHDALGRDGLTLADLERHRIIGRLFRHVLWLEWAMAHLDADDAPDAWRFIEDTSYDSRLTDVAVT